MALSVITVKNIETNCVFPDDLLIVDEFNRELVVEWRDGRVFMCSMSLDAGWEALEYVKTIHTC